MADGLDIKLIDQFNQKLDATYTKLIQLDAELKKFEKLATIDLKVGPGLRGTSRALDELSRAMNRFANASPERISNAAKGVIQFVEQFALAAKKAETKNVGALAKFLRDTSASIQELGNLQRSFGDTSQKQKNSAKRLVDDTILPLVKMIKELLKIGTDVTPERLRAISDSFRSIGALFKILADVTTTVGRMASGAGPGKKDLDQFKDVFKMVTDLLSLTQKEDLTPGRIQAAANAFQQVGILFSIISKISTQLDSLSGRSIFKNFLRVDPVKQFQKIMGIVRSFFYLAQNLSPERLKNLAEAFRGISGLFRSLGDTVQVIEGLTNKFKFPTSLLRQILVFQRIIKPFVDVAIAISKIGVGTAKGKGGVTTTFTGFRDLVTGLAKAVDVIYDLRNKFELPTSLFRNLLTFERIADVIAKVAGRFNRELKGANPQAFSALEPLVRAINRTIRLLLELETEFREFGSLLRSLALFERAAGRLVNIAKEFAKIKGNAETLKGAAALIEGLIRFFRELLLINNDRTSFENLDKNLGFIEKIGKRLGTVLKSIAANAGVGNVKDLAALLENLRSLKDVAEIFNKDVGKDINDSSSVFTRLRETISGAVTEGILRANLLIKAFNLLKNVVLSLGKAFLKLIFPPAIVLNNLRSLRAIGDALREIGDNIRDTGEQMRDFGFQFIQNFGIGKLFESAAVQAAVGFDKLSDQVRVFGNLTEEGVQQAEELAFVIGQKYPLSANEALAAILDLTKAGQGLSSTEFILPAAANLAALSESGDLNTVIEGLIAAEGAFTNFRNASEGVAAVEGTFENIAIATDILAAGANVSTASVESLTQGLGNVGTAANTFGLSLEETVAVLSIFEDAGLRAAEGGTALRSLLNALDRPQTATALRNLGVALFDTETGARRPLNDIITDINAALEDMPEAQKVAVLQQLSDTFGRQGLNILLAEGANGIDAVVDSMNALPTAAEQAQQLLDNLAGDILQLQGSVETFMLRAALPMLERFFRPFVQVARLAVDGLLTLDQSFFEFLGTSIALTSVLATLIGGFLIFTGAVLQVGGAVFTVVGALLNFQLILGGIVAFTGAFLTGILAITAALVVFVPLIVGLSSIFETLFAVFSTNAGNASSAALGFFGTLRSTIETVANFIGSFINLLNVFVFQSQKSEDKFNDLGESIASFFGSLASVFTSGFIGDMRIVLGQLSQIFNAFALFKSTSQEIADLSLSLGGFGDSFNVLGETMSRGDVEARLASLRASIRDTFANLVQNVPLFRDAVQNLFGDTSDASIQAFVDRIFAALDQIRIGFERITGAFGTFIANILRFDLGANFRGLLTNLDQGFTEFTLGFVDLFEDFFGSNALTDAIRIGATEGMEGIGRSLIGLLLSSIQNAIVSNRDTLKDMFLSVVDGFFGLLRNLRFITDLLGAGPISDLFESFQGVLRELLGGVFDTIINLIAGQSLGDALYNAFGDSIKPLFDFVDTITRIFTALQRIFTNIVGFFTSGTGIGEAAASFFNFEGIVEGILNFVNSIAQFLDLLALGDSDAIIKRIQDFFTGIFGNVQSFITNILPNIQTFLGEFIAGLGDAFKNYLISIGVPPEFIEFGESVLNLAATAVSDAFNATVSTATMIIADPAGFFNRIANQLKTFILTDGPALFAGLGTSIVETITTAIDTAMAGIEKALGIDFQPAIDTISTSLDSLFTALEELLFGNEATGEVTIIEEIITLIERIAAAFVGLFDALTSEDTDNINQPLQFVIDFAAGIAAYGIDTITDLVVAIDDLFNFFTTADPEAIAALGVAIAVFAGPTTLGLLASALGLVATAWSTFVTALNGVIIPALLVLVVIQALVQNVDELLDVFEKIGEGDFSGALVEFGDFLLNLFADITGNTVSIVNLLLGLFGFEPIQYDRNAVVELGRGLYTAFENAGHALELTFDRIIADFGANIAIWTEDLTNSITGVRDLANERAQIFFERDEFSLQNLDDFANTNLEGNESYVQSLAILDQEEISRQVRAEIQAGIEAGEPVPVSAADVITLRDLEVLSRTIEDAIYSGDIDVAAAIFGTDILSPEEVSASVEDIIYAFEQGFITAAEAETLLLAIEVEPTYPGADEINADVADARAQIAAELAETPPVEAEIPVEGVPVVQEGGDVATFEQLEAETTAQIEAAQEELNRQAAVPVYVPYEVVPVVTEGGEGGAPAAEGESAIEPETLDLQGANAADVAALSSDLQNLQTYAALVKVDLDALLPTLQQLGVDLGTTQVAFDNNTTSMIAYITQVGLLNTGYTNLLLNMLLINLNLLTLGLSFTNFGLQASLALNLVSIATQTFQNQLLVMMNTFIQGFILVEKAANDLAKTLANVVGKAQELATVVDDAAAAAAASGGGGGSQPPPDDGGNAAGGSFSGRNKKRRGFGKYQIGEGGSEVLFENGKMYLLSRGEGRIATLPQALTSFKNSSSTGLYPTVASAGSRAGGNNVSNVTIEGPEINVTISGAGANAQQIADEVLTKVQAGLEQQTKNVRHELRINHRG